MQGSRKSPAVALAAAPPSESLAVGAYNRLREAIVTGELRPNQRLVETELAEWLEVSRTPLREGLARLATEGLVTSRRRGWIVREHTPEEISEMHEVRAALEGMAVYLAAGRATDEEIEELAEFHAAQDRVTLAAAPRAALVEYNDAFHQAIVTASRSERLRHFIGLNRDFSFSYQIARLFSEEEAARTVEGHDEVIAALRARDADRGERAMRAHILEARDFILAKLS